MFDSVKKCSESKVDIKNKIILIDIRVQCIYVMQRVLTISEMPVAAIKKGASVEAKAIVSKLENMHTDLEKNMKRIEDRQIV